MPWGVAAATAIGAGGSIYNGIMGRNAAKDAAGAQVQAANIASQTERDMFNQTTAREQPFVNAGTNALGSLQQLLGIGPGGAGATSPILKMLGLGPGGTGNIDPSTFQGSPGYQYQLQQGTNAVTNSAHGNLGGNMLRALQQTGQGLANQNWNQYLGQSNNAFNSLVGNVSNLVGTGASAAGQLGTIGTNVAGQIGGNQIGAGNAQAGGIIGGANAMAGGIDGLLKALATGAMASGGGNGSTSALISSLFSGGGPLSANTLNTNFGTQFGEGTFPSASNPNAIVPGYMPDNYTRIR